MILMQGQGVSQGVIKDFCHRHTVTIIKETSNDLETEKTRLDKAQSKSKDVTQRTLSNLMGIVGGIDSEEPVILASDDLALFETLQPDKSKILGFVTKSIAKTCTLERLEV